MDKLAPKALRQAFHRIKMRTQGPGLYEFTQEAARWLRSEKVHEGLLTIFCRHTSASLLVQENADSSVQRDLCDYFKKIAPESSVYEHQFEGPDDMPAHLRAALTQTSLGVPIYEGNMVLGAWQGLYLFEHRAQPHMREIVFHFMGM